MIDHLYHVDQQRRVPSLIQSTRDTTLQRSWGRVVDATEMSRVAQTNMAHTLAGDTAPVYDHARA